MNEVEKRISVHLKNSSLDPENESSVESGDVRSREMEQVVDFLGKVLQQVSKFNSLSLLLGLVNSFLFLASFMFVFLVRYIYGT